MDLFSRKKGDSGEPVIVLHGLFGSNDNQGGVIRALSESYQVYGVDLRNHGKSPHAPVMGYDAMAADVIRLMDKLGLESAHFVGHSMGGKTAMQLALSHADRVKRLCVLDIAPVQYDHPHTAILKGLEAVSKQTVTGRKQVMELLTPYEDNPAILSFLATNWRRGEDGQWGLRLNLKAITDDYSAIVAGNYGTPFDGDVLFVRGSESTYIMPEHRDEILHFFPQASVRTVKDAGHWLHAEKPDMVQRIVKRFLDSGE